MPMRKYVPNDRDREIVLHMAAIPGVTREQIAFCITNERTGKPINRRTLEKHFSKELETGMTAMAKITMQSFVEQIKAHVWPATRLALANYCGLKDNADVAVTANNISPHINVSFVPSPHSNEPIPGDLNIDLKANPPPHLQLPKRDAFPMVLPEPDKPPEPRTELDVPGYWDRAKVAGQAPIMGAKRGNWMG